MKKNSACVFVFPLGLTVFSCLGHAQSIEVPPIVGRTPGNPPNYRGGIMVNVPAGTVRLNVTPNNIAPNTSHAFWEYKPPSTTPPTWNWAGNSMYDYSYQDNFTYEIRRYSVFLEDRSMFAGTSSISVQLQDQGGSLLGLPIGAMFDGRTDAQKAGAPKLDFDKIVVQPMNDGCWATTVVGRVNDSGPLDPNGLRMTWDKADGGRGLAILRPGADGTFSGTFDICPTGDIANIRPLVMYSRTPGDSVNVGYSGSAARIERRHDVLDLRESIEVRVKARGHFRFKAPTAVMGVRG